MPETKNNRLEVLDGLRGIAILLVFFFHGWPSQLHPAEKLLGFDFSPLLRTAFWGVELFFFLSGFCLFLPYAQARFDGKPLPKYSHFIARRAIKILPSYVVAIAGMFLIGEAVFPSTSEALRQIVLHLLFIHTWFADSYMSISSVLWSLGTEVQFYVLFPAVAWLMLRRPFLTMGLALLLASAYRITYAYTASFATQRLMEQLPAKIDVFVSGMLAAYLFRMLSTQYPASVRQQKAWTLLAMEGIALYLYTAHKVQLLAGHPWPQLALPWAIPLLDLAFTALTLGSLFAVSGWRRLIANRLFTFFALISYNFYLWHQAFIDFMRRGVFSWDEHSLRCVLISALCAVALSTLLTYVVEIPLLRLRLRKHPPELLPAQSPQ